MEKAEDGSIIGDDGRLIYCSTERFLRDVIEAHHCFICGRSKAEVPFNREHILPNWMLHRFNLHKKEITLPNGETHQYGTYTLPCCKDCNSEMAREFETPISAAFETGYAGVTAMLEDEGPDRLFQWMTLIFLKMHLKDRSLRRYLHEKLGKEMIAADYVWETFHHLHAVGRARHSGTALGPNAIGSLVVLPMRLLEDEREDRFDLVARTEPGLLYLRADDCGIFAIMNDAGASAWALDPYLALISGPLNILQAREVAAEFGAANHHLENRPEFSTMLSSEGDPVIVGQATGWGWRFAEKDIGVVGALKASMFEEFMDIVAGDRPLDIARQLVAEGKITMMFDANGQFVQT